MLKRTTSSGSADWLESGEFAFGGTRDLQDNESELLKAVELRNHRHVQLFRQLQAHWQCYDAYARVCMALGVRQLIQAVTYFLIGLLLVDNEAPTVAFMATLAFQSLAVSISVLDIHGLPCYGNLDLSIIGMLPALVACTSLCLAPRTAEGALKEDHTYFLALAAYPLEICWFEILYWVAAPTRDEAAVPSHFRTVLFMDVFGEVDDPTDADFITGHRILTPEERTLIQIRVSSAEGALGVAQAALRRWEAVPAGWLSAAQRRSLRRYRRQVALWGEVLDRELEVRRMSTLSCGQRMARGWAQLTPAEREDDPLAGTVLGPLEHFTGTGLLRHFYYDLEREGFLYELQGDRRLLTVSQAGQAVRSFRREVQAVRTVARVGARASGVRVCSHSFSSTWQDTGPLSPDNLARTRSACSISTCSASPRRSRSETQKPPVKIIVPRLPWRLTSVMTRVVQVAWVFVGAMGALNEWRVFKLDTQEANIAEERRLLASEQATSWSFEVLEARWPQGSLFRPELLACLPAAAPLAEEGGNGTLLVGSPYVFHSASFAGQPPLQFEELPLALDPLPLGAALLCGLPPASPATRMPCLLGAPNPQGGVELWRPTAANAEDRPEDRKTSLIEVDGDPWLLMAGAALPCEATLWCLVLAGWSAREELSVALVAMGSLLGPADLSPDPGDGGGAPRLLQQSTWPLAGTAKGDDALAALHVELDGSRLWTLTVGGGLEAWDLLPLPARLLGRWRPIWPSEAKGFWFTALCKEPGGRGLFVAGRLPDQDGGPLLLRTSAGSQPGRWKERAEAKRKPRGRNRLPFLQ